MIKNLKKIVPTTLAALCIMSTVCSTDAFAREINTRNVSTTKAVSNVSDGVACTNDKYWKTYGFDVSFGGEIYIGRKNGNYYIESIKDTSEPSIGIKYGWTGNIATLVAHDYKLLSNNTRIVCKADVKVGDTILNVESIINVDPNTGAITYRKNG